MKSITKHIPNFITCLNLLSGCLGIAFVLGNKGGGVFYACAFIGVGALMDFLDGFVARLLQVHSTIGKQLDSLADLVTFGVLPGFILFSMFDNAFEAWNFQADASLRLLKYSALLIPVFSALRLAKFNVDLRQADQFIGLPTPASSILVASLPFIVLTDSILLEVQIHRFASQPLLLFYTLLNPFFLMGLIVLLCFLMVAELPLFALKFKHFNWKGNEVRFVFIATSLLLVVVLKFTGIPVAIGLYLLLSYFFNLSKKT